MERLERADEATGLLEYSADFEEPTGRHEVNVIMQQPTVPQPSQPQIEVSQPTPGVWTIAIKVVDRLRGGWLVAAILIAALAALRWFGKL
jgi:hypothetical protein